MDEDERKKFKFVSKMRQAKYSSEYEEIYDELTDNDNKTKSSESEDSSEEMSDTGAWIFFIMLVVFALYGIISLGVSLLEA